MADQDNPLTQQGGIPRRRMGFGALMPERLAELQEKSRQARRENKERKMRLAKIASGRPRPEPDAR